VSQASIPFHRPSIGKEELQALQAVLESRWLTTGPVAQQFEREFAAYVGCRHALAVNSCTAALHLALDCAGIRPGDEVLLPTYTFTATAEVVTYMGAVPVLCDSVRNGFNIDPLDAERRINSKTRALVAVHIAGEACNLDPLRRLAATHDLHLIEDAAHSLPASYRGKRLGAESELAAFSFYATKTITTAEGGMLVTNSDHYAQRAAQMRLHGISGDAWKRYSSEGTWYYEVVEAGFKMNMPDLLAALGVAQLRKADAFHKRRCEIADIYLRRFAAIEELQLPPHHEADSHSWHLFILRLRPELLTLKRNDFVRELKRAGIETSVHFIPLHLHPYYQRRFGYRPGDFANAEDAYSRAISLPIFPDMTADEVERVVRTVENLVVNSRRRLLVNT
jgi:dTDP-4-amino-4,6-dideoxygalactose transaminase